MLDQVLVIVAFVLLLGGVAGSLIPQVPGALISVAGVLLYWFATDFSQPGTLALVALVLVGVLTMALDWAGGVVAARVAGASNRTAVLAGLVGMALFFVTGPLGIIAGVAVTVFVVELYRQEDLRSGAKAAAVTTLGMLGTAVVQATLTASMLLAMVAVHVL